MRTLIGWVEYVDFPEWGVRRLRAKVDTGARSCALHVEGVERLDGGRRVRFVVVPDQPGAPKVSVECDVAREGRVRPSSGESEQRLFVRTKLKVGEVEEDVELSLVDRRRMRYRMLIGRKFLARRFVVDAGRRFVLGRRRP